MVPHTGAAKVDVEVGVRAALAHEAVVLNLWVDHTGHEGMKSIFRAVGFVQSFADFVSVTALLFLLRMPSPPAALAFGYWLTTAGCVAGMAGFALMHLAMARTGETAAGGVIGEFFEVTFQRPPPGQVLGWGGRVFALLVGVPCAVLCSIALYLLVLAPLQLSGVAHGLAPPCDAWLLPELCDIYK